MRQRARLAYGAPERQFAPEARTEASRLLPQTKLLGLPNDLDWVAPKCGIVCDDRQCFDEGRGDEQAIEGVAVMERQLGDAEQVRALDRQRFDGVAPHGGQKLVGEGFCQFDLSDRLLD